MKYSLISCYLFKNLFKIFLIIFFKPCRSPSIRSLLQKLDTPVFTDLQSFQSYGPILHQISYLLVPKLITFMK